MPRPARGEALTTKSYGFFGSKRNQRFSMGKENFFIMILEQKLEKGFFFVLA